MALLSETTMSENCESIPILSTQVGDDSPHAEWLPETITSLIR